MSIKDELLNCLVELKNYFEELINSIEELKINVVNKKVYYFNNIEEMKSCLYLVEDSMSITKGYYTSNDGGSGEYEIINDDSLVDDGGSIFTLNNGLRAKLIVSNGEINIKQFGAKGNGIDHDNVYIQNAIDFAKSKINKIIIPEGDFLINVRNPLNLSADTCLSGCGSKSIIKADINTFEKNAVSDSTEWKNSIIKYSVRYDANKTSTDDTRILIENLVIDGNITEDTKSSILISDSYSIGHGVGIGYANNVKILNCEIKNTLGTGILCDKSYGITIDNCYIHGCALYYPASNCAKNGISLKGSIQNTDKLKYNIVCNCYIEDIYDEAIMFGQSPVNIHHNFIYNCNDCGIEGDSAEKSIIDDETNFGDCIIDSNYILSNKRFGINIANVSNQKIIISNNIVKDNLICGLQINQQIGGKTIISNNIFSGTNTSETNKHAIYIYSSSINFHNNIIYNNINYNGAVFGAICDNISINDNLLYSLTAGVACFSINSEDIIISNNIVKDINQNVNRLITFNLNKLKNLSFINNTIDGIKGEIMYTKSSGDINSIYVKDNRIINSCNGKVDMIQFIGNENSVNTIKLLNVSDNFFAKDDETVTLRNFVNIDGTFNINNFIGKDNIFDEFFKTSNVFYFVNQPTNKII